MKALFIAISILAVTSASCRNETEEAETEVVDPVEVETAEQPEGTVENIEEEPTEFIGERVSVSGEVGEVHNERAFMVKDDDLIWDEEVLVLTREPVRFQRDELLEDGEEVIVRGKVNYMVVADLERELGWDIGTEIEAEYSGKPVVIAERVARVQETAMWTEDAAQLGTDPQATAPQAIEEEPSPL